ncbi:MAG: peroxiredoxin [Gemmatimonadales bacterium]|nr:MAG: peroxiredoxin [Gemmatimonadales bacterium]
MTLVPGDTAPDFTLTHRVGADAVRLSGELRKGPVVVLFFPLAFSPACTTEICTVAEDWGEWESLGATVLGISVDSPYVNARFAESCGATFPILSDFNRDVATAWGVRNDDFYGMRGVANRAAFVVDPSGAIRWSWVTEDASVQPDFAAIRDELRRMSQGLAAGA